MWFNKLKPEEKDTIEHLRTMFMEKFKGEPKWLVQRKLITRKIRPGETLDQLATDIVTMATKLGKSEHDLSSYLFNALPNHLQNFVLMKDDNCTFDQCLIYAKLGQSVEISNSPGVLKEQSSLNVVGTLKYCDDILLCSCCELPGHESYTCPQQLDNTFINEEGSN